MDEFDEKDIMKETGERILLIAVLVITALLVLLPAVLLHAEGPMQLASVQRYDNSRAYTASRENDNLMPDGIDAASCAAFGAIPAVVEGPTVLEFWWRGSDTGAILFTVNGKTEAVECKDNGWKKFRYVVKEAGTHFVKWVYKPA